MQPLHSHYETAKHKHPKRVPNTCLWFLNNPTFVKWFEHNSKATLLVLADPGCGKSVLCRTLVDEIFNPPPPQCSVCYFFFQEDNVDLNKSTAALSAIIFQMVEQDKSLINYVEPWYKRRQTGLSESFHALWAILRDIIDDPKPRTIVCVLDAIDECEPVSRTLLIEGMGEFDAYQRDKRSQLKFLVTGRPYTEIDRQFRRNCSDLALIDMEDDRLSDQVGKEINLVIDDKVPRIFNSFRHPPNTRTQTEIVKKLKGNNNRTYLWLKLMLDAINATTLPGDHQWAAFVKQMPTGLFDVYANILNKIDPQKREETIKLFRILFAATRTLTLKELNVALVVVDRIKRNRHNARSTHDLCFFDEQKLADYIRDISGRTVTIVGSNVYFIHLTMREFLTTGNFLAASWFSQSFQISHNTLAEICIWYILRQFEQQFGKQPLPSAWKCPLLGEKRDQTSYGEWYKGHHRDVKHFVETDPFLPYAELRWATHVRNSGDDLQIELLPYVLELCGLKSKASIMWFQFYHTHRWFWDVARPTEFPTFVIIAACGLKAVLQKIWDNACDANIDFQSQDFLQYPLRLSLLALVAREGHTDVVKFLLDKSAHPSPHPELNGMTPLHHAAYRGHCDTVKLLVEEGHARISTLLPSPVRFALNAGHISIAEYLLRKDNRAASDALFNAANCGDSQAIEELVETYHANVDVQADDWDGMTPLMLACGFRHVEAAKLLIEKYDADVNAQCPHRKTPLHYAVVMDGEFWKNIEYDTIELLISRDDIKVDIKDRDGETPLKSAIASGDMYLVRFLREMFARYRKN
jgi:ankyrin repeat protein